MRRREFISFLASVAASRPIVAHAQHAGMPVVGVVGSGLPAAYAERLTLIRQGLAETGLPRAAQWQSNIDGRKVSWIDCRA